MRDPVSSYSNFYRTPLGKEVLCREACYVAGTLGSCERIIHVGCGPGLLEEAIPQANILGVDISVEMLREARKHTSRHLVLADGQHLCFKECAFDGVLFVTSLEFIEDYAMALKEAHRVLRPEGKLLALMLNPESEYFKERASMRGSYFSRVRHTASPEIMAAAETLFRVHAEYLLGIRGTSVFDTSDPALASLCAIHGRKSAAPAP